MKAIGKSNCNSKSKRTILLAFTTFALVIACNPPANNTPPKGMKVVSLEHNEAVLFLPKTFKHVSLTELEELYRGQVSQDEFEAIQKIAGTLRASHLHVEIFMDTINLNNSAWFSSGPHVTLTKDKSEDYMGMAEEQLESQWGNSGVTYERLACKFKSGGYKQIIKAKYQLTKQSFLNQPGFVKYVTQYLISTKKHTIGVTVHSTTIEGLEDEIEGMKVNE